MQERVKLRTPGQVAHPDLLASLSLLGFSTATIACPDEEAHMRTPRVYVDGAPVLDVQLVERALQRLGAAQRHRKAVRLELEAPAQDVARQAQDLHHAP